MISLRSPLKYLIITVPTAFILRFTDGYSEGSLIFLCSALALLPCALMLAKCTERLAAHFGTSIGAVINATFGNLPELIIAVLALKKGYHFVVIASLGGAILGNMLLVLGLSISVAGIKYRTVKYEVTQVRAASTGMIIICMALLAPTLYQFIASQSLGAFSYDTQLKLSLTISVILLAAYVFQLIFSLVTHRRLPRPVLNENESETEEEGTWQQAFVKIVMLSVVIAFLASFMVSSLDRVINDLGLTEAFIGIFIVAIVGSVAEQSSAIVMAAKNRMNLSMEIALGSSLQVAMFIAPVIVVLSFLMGTPMPLDFGLPIAAAVLASAWVVSTICSHGESTWLHGVQLLVLYAIFAVLFFFMPATTF